MRTKAQSFCLASCLRVLCLLQTYWDASFTCLAFYSFTIQFMLAPSIYLPECHKQTSSAQWLMQSLSLIVKMGGC